MAKFKNVTNATVETARAVNEMLIETVETFECQKWGMDTLYQWMVSATCENMISAWFWAIFAQIVFIILVLILWHVISYRFDNSLAPMVHDNSNYNQLRNETLNVDEIISNKSKNVQDVGSINSSTGQWQY